MDAAVEHALPMLAVQVVTAAAAILAFLPALVSPAFVVLAFPAALLVTYLLYGAPYLVVLDRSATDALAGSYRLALDSREYRSFGLRYLGVAAVASIPLTALATNAGVLGVLAAAAIAAYPSYVGSVATMRVVADAD